jgi:hypothetical protein
MTSFHFWPRLGRSVYSCISLVLEYNSKMWDSEDVENRHQKEKEGLREIESRKGQG